MHISPTPHFIAFARAMLFHGADFIMAQAPLPAMVVIGSVCSAFALSRLPSVIFGG